MSERLRHLPFRYDLSPGFPPALRLRYCKPSNALPRFCRFRCRLPRQPRLLSRCGLWRGCFPTRSGLLRNPSKRNLRFYRSRCRWGQLRKFLSGCAYVLPFPEELIRELLTRGACFLLLIPRENCCLREVLLFLPREAFACRISRERRLLYTIKTGQVFSCFISFRFGF